MKIKQIIIVCQQGTSLTCVGGVIGNVEIVEIKDESIEFESSVVMIYVAYDIDGNVLKRIENCPCDITYYSKLEVGE